MRTDDNEIRRGERKREFDHNRVPPVADYCRPIFCNLQFTANGWELAENSEPYAPLLPDKGLREQTAKGAPEEPLPPAPNREELLAAHWVRRELPPRDHLLGALVCTTSRILMFGPTGIGKTITG